MAWMNSFQLKMLTQFRQIKCKNLLINLHQFPNHNVIKCVKWHRRELCYYLAECNKRYEFIAVVLH